MKSEFGAATPAHREAIRADLAAELGLGDVDDLTRRPQPEGWSVSISHAPDLGGWLAAPRPLAIGFDVELRARVTEKVVARVAKPEELAMVGDPALLWAAKEALFKARARGTPTVLSHLIVTSWSASADGVFAFTGAGGATGVAAADARHAFALAVVSSRDV